MKKLILLILAFVAIATGASAATDYGFQILHVGINSDNYQSQSQGKAWSYDPSANVLHLKDGTISTLISSATILKIDGDVNPSLKIQVDGNCSFSGSFSAGIEFTGKGQYTICGEGTLKMNSDKTNPQVIVSYGNTSLTIKDVTINIEAWGDAAVGFLSSKFNEIVLDNCEMNIKTSAYAGATFGSASVNPTFKKCFNTKGYFSNGSAYDDDGYHLKELYIKRAISVIDVTVDEPIAGNVISTNCTSSSADYYAKTVEWHHSVDGNSYAVITDGSLFITNEYYRVYVLLYSAEGNRFANKDDITVYVNGKEAIINSTGGGDYVIIMYTFPQLEPAKYDLWVGGVQVNEVNKDNVLGNGKVKYAPATKTLSLLDGITINGQGRANDAATGYGAGIYSEIDGLTIDVARGGVEFLGADDCHGIYLRGKTTIKGEGSLYGKGYIGVFMGSNSADLTVDGNVMLVAEGTTTYGLGGYVRGFAGNINYYTTLTVKGTAKVMAIGELGSLRNWNDLVLEDSHAITSPPGAVWNADKHAVCDASGNPIAGEWVSIIKVANPYDLNGDEKVSTADIQVIINEMKKPQASQDMKYDLNNDGKISTADIQVIINEMKK
jgi:hypothetical protein